MNPANPEGMAPAVRLRNLDSPQGVTPCEQVFSAENYLETPRTQIVKEIAPGGHIGLFLGKETLAAKWRGIAAWIQRAA
ncbi:MAG: hypothetical protein AB7Q76_01305 [Gammaproteobacteria bacterium]